MLEHELTSNRENKIANILDYFIISVINRNRDFSGLNFGFHPALQLFDIFLGNIQKNTTYEDIRSLGKLRRYNSTPRKTPVLQLDIIGVDESFFYFDSILAKKSLTNDRNMFGYKYWRLTTIYSLSTISMWVTYIQRRMRRGVVHKGGFFSRSVGYQIALINA